MSLCGITLGCDSVEPADAAAETERAVVLATVDFDDGRKVQILDADGDVLVTQTRRDGQVPALAPDDMALPLDQLFAKLRPGQAMPPALSAAVERSKQAHPNHILRATTPASAPAPRRPEAASASGTPTAEIGDISKRTSALTAAEFQQSLCGWTNVNQQWCFLNGGEWGYAINYNAHRMKAILYADVGQTTLRLCRPNDTRTACPVVAAFDALPGTWVYIYNHYDSHSWFSADTRTYRFDVLNAAGKRFHFSGFFYDDDRFISGP